MVSLDVVSLFTKVPTGETLTVVRDKLTADSDLEERTCTPMDNLMEMLTFCVETTYFEMGSDIYRQEEGLAMGSPLSPVLANIYIEYFKEIALGSTPLKPSMWLRYVFSYACSVSAFNFTTLIVMSEDRYSSGTLTYESLG